jgi:Gram-negative porin
VIERRRILTLSVSVLSLLFLVRPGAAEVILGKTDGGWTFASEGRVGGFVELVRGDGLPDGTNHANGMMLHSIGDGGINILGDPVAAVGGGSYPGPISASRVRSGFLGNILAFSVRREVSDTTRMTGFISIWANVETDSRRKFLPEVPDAREGYVRVEGPAGTLLVGRALTLYSRGAVEIDYLYAHRYGVGNPAGFDDKGPSGGQIGYGVLANGFSAGVAYATPLFHGLQLTAGYYDPSTFVGLYWGRTKYGRPEAELTYDLAFGALGRIHLFANGAWQKIYASGSTRDTTVYGGGAGGRFEFGFFHLGVAGHSGQGLGINYAFDGSQAIFEQTHSQQMRKFDGVYVQTQFVVQKFDLSVGWGETRVHEVPADVDPAFFVNGMPLISVLKDQIGINAGIVYHFSDSLHFDLDYFRAEAHWWLGENQVVNTYNSGLTMNW